MTTQSTTKTMARLEARFSPEIKSLLLKSLLQKKTDFEDVTLSAVVIAVKMAAIATIKKHQTLKKHQIFKKRQTLKKSQMLKKQPFIKLNREDSEAFVEALLNPPLPNEALLAAALLYKETISV